MNAIVVEALAGGPELKVLEVVGFMRCATCKMDRPPYRYGGQVNKNKNKDGDIDMAVGRAEPTIHR